MQGAVNPDKYVVFKPLLVDARLRPIVEKTRGAKARKMVHAAGGSARTITVQTTRKERETGKLTLVQARPETVVSTRRAGVIKAYRLLAAARHVAETERRLGDAPG